MAASSPAAHRPTAPAQATEKQTSKAGRGAKGNQDVDESKLQSGKRLAITFSALMLTLFLIALDQTILGPALPVISSHFNSLRQSAWVVSAFVLTQASFMLIFGQLLMMYDQKFIYLAAIFIFEIGSLVCAVAPNVNVLIFGRALAGVGAGGIFVALISIIAVITRLEQRAMLMGTFAAVFGISSIIAPILGGVFTQHASWRWCFYINLPIGGLAMAHSAWQIPRAPAPPMQEEQKETIRTRWRFITRGKFVPEEGSWLFTIMLLDVVGAILQVAALVCLLLALVWGGSQYPWGSGQVIGTFVAAGVLTALTILWEYFCAGAAPVIPLRFFTHKTIIGCSIVGFMLFFGMFILTYYLPELFEAVHNNSPTTAGLKTLPFMGSFIFTTIASSVFVRKTGRYWYLMASFPTLLCIASGLFFTIHGNTKYAKIAGFQVIYGAGIGPAFQNVFLAVQANVHPRQISQATGAVALFQRLGGSVGIAVAGSVLNTQLKKEFKKYAPTANYGILSESVSAIWDESVTPPDIRAGVIKAYSEALRYVYVIGVPLGGIAIIAVILLIRNTDVRRKRPGAPTTPVELENGDAAKDDGVKSEQSSTTFADPDAKPVEEPDVIDKGIAPSGSKAEPEEVPKKGG